MKLNLLEEIELLLNNAGNLPAFFLFTFNDINDMINIGNLKTYHK
jgi:hypothetical protein